MFWFVLEMAATNAFIQLRNLNPSAKDMPLKEFRCSLDVLYFMTLQPDAAFSMVLQNDELCVINAIESILKTSNAITKLKTTPFEELPTVKTVLQDYATLKMR